jgi:hypothetical protein
MKNLSGTRLYIAVAALAVAALLGFQAVAQRPTPTPNQPAFVLTINQITDTVHGQADFEKVLDELQTNLFELYSYDRQTGCRKHTYHMPHHAHHDPCPPGGTPQSAASPGTAQNEGIGELTYIQQRTTIKVPSMYASDIQKVANELK